MTDENKAADVTGFVSGQHLSTDYLVVGAGAAAMAFVDTLLSETSYDVIIVDQHDAPGGHWNDAYPFVRLHQPSAYYGVASLELGTGLKMIDGPNAGFYELASKSEILAYYDRVMRQRFLCSGRVRYFPCSEYQWTRGKVHLVRSTVSGNTMWIAPRRKIVNATHARTEVPSTHGVPYAIAPGVNHATVNRLPELRQSVERFTVVGGGKTGMDACCWLLGHGVEPSRLRWVVPRDSWTIDRAAYQPGPENFVTVMRGSLAHLQSIIDASSIPHLFTLLEERNVLRRLDTNISPTMYHCANLSDSELLELRKIDDIVRQGHVTSVESHQIRCELGNVDARPTDFYLDCSAYGLQPQSELPVFDASTINLLMVRWCQPVFSAAFIAFIESRSEDDRRKNAFCRPVCMPETPLDWLRMWGQTLNNLLVWEQDPNVLEWVSRCRLDLISSGLRDMPDGDPRRDLLATFSAIAHEAARSVDGLMASC